MIIVDYSQTAISTLMAELRGRTDAEISLPLVRHMIINAIRSYKKRFGEEYGEIVLACDNKHYWRKRDYPFYKANRKKARDDSGFDWSAIFEALNQIKQEISENFPYPVVEVHTAEADDVIASLVEWTQDNDLVQIGLGYEPQPVLILSGDHDFAQLQKYKNVSQYSPIFKKWVKSKNPEKELVEKILLGDKGDGIPNFLSDDDTFIEGKRQKPIRKKDLNLWTEQPITVWDGTPHESNVRRNTALIDLSYIPSGLKEDVINNFIEQKGVRDRSKLLNYFIAHRMKNLMDHITEF